MLLALDQWAELIQYAASVSDRIRLEEVLFSNGDHPALAKRWTAPMLKRIAEDFSSAGGTTHVAAIEIGLLITYSWWSAGKFDEAVAMLRETGAVLKTERPLPPSVRRFVRGLVKKASPGLRRISWKILD